MLHALTQDSGIILKNPVISSNLTDKDVIFGGEKALAKALDAAAEKNPALIIAATSCVPETIGDDSEMVCKTHASSAKILYLPTSGFLGGSSEDGENIALETLSALAPIKEIEPRTAVLIGEKNLETEAEENYAEISRLLSRLRIRIILRFCRNITAADIENLGRAAVFIVRDSRVLRAGKKIAERFSRPYISEFPRGFSGSIQFIRDAGKACGIPEDEIEAAVNEEKTYQKKMLEPFAELRGTSVFLGIEPLAGTFSVAREAMQLLEITESPDGLPVKLPFYLPVGVSGTVKMLYLWRRQNRK